MPAERFVPSWRGRDPLQWLLGPTSTSSFLKDYWERSALVIQRDDSSYFDELLTFDDVNEFMSRNDIRYPYLRLVKNGRELPLVDYADDFLYGTNVFPGLLDADKVFHHYADGATLSFQIFQKCMRELSAFCNAFEARCRFQSQVNIFVTPPNSKGFTAHYDDHSFFILQIAGTKYWNVYESPVELPLQEFRSRLKTPALGEPRQRITLRAGDLLYLPKGFYHDASTRDETSVHITLGMFPYTWLQVFESRLAELKEDVEFRRAPYHYLEAGLDSTEGQEEFERLTAKLRDTKIGDAFNALFTEAASKQIVDAKDRLRDINAADSLRGTTVMSRREILCELDEDEDGVMLRFYDKSLRFPLGISECLGAILSATTFTSDQLPGRLGPSEKLAVVRVLLKEGLLTLGSAS